MLPWFVTIKQLMRFHMMSSILAHSNSSSSQSHANSSYSPQPYYVTLPSSVADYDDEYQGELQGDSQEDKLTTAIMLLARTITQKFSTPTNHRLRTLSNTRNQAVIQDGQLIYKPRMQVMVEMAHTCLLWWVSGEWFAGEVWVDRDSVYRFWAGNGEQCTVHSVLNVGVTGATSEVNALNKVHEQVNHVKHKPIIHISDDDHINSNIMFDDPYVKNNGGGASEHDSNAHDKYHDIQMLEYNVQREAENQK
uniref:Uncharacterized protein n=1 Tax=Tanacetum cinerariifolium TaxID=118510 RepID=A0A6L2MEJ5_TANCI|nr:hypothetical protein [Tanacetum cinerariifolium]